MMPWIWRQWDWCPYDSEIPEVHSLSSVHHFIIYHMYTRVSLCPSPPPSISYSDFSTHTEEAPCANVVNLLPLHTRVRVLIWTTIHMFIMDMGFYGWGDSQTFCWRPLLHLPRASDRSNTVEPAPSNVTFKPLVGSPFARCVNSRILNNMESTSVPTEHGRGSGCFLT